jgi:predicted NBD/HSP70 family sugar kinase
LRIKQKLIANVEAELLRRVRSHEGLSRVDLARQLHLAPSTIGAYVNRLIEEGFLFERQKADRDFGRPPTLLALNPQGGRFIGVDFEAENLMATLVDFSQQPIRRVHQTMNAGETAEAIIDRIEAAIAELMEGHESEILGIGIGVPGTIDRQNQVALHYEYIRGWKNIALGERLKNRFKVDIFLENNIRSMALAELWFGHGRGLENFVCLGIRTGIAAGIISGGKLLCGQQNVAGEMGQWLCPTGPTCDMEGKSDSPLRYEMLRPLEQVASVPALLKAVRTAKALRPLDAPGTLVSLDEILREARAGDTAVLAVLKDLAHTLGWVLCQISALLDPKKVVLAGPLVALGDFLLNPLQEAVAAFGAQTRQRPPQVTLSELGAFNGALGAAALALHEWKPKR